MSDNEKNARVNLEMYYRYLNRGQVLTQETLQLMQLDKNDTHFQSADRFQKFVGQTFESVFEGHSYESLKNTPLDDDFWYFVNYAGTNLRNKVFSRENGY